jgi:hypothetical protein
VSDSRGIEPRCDPTANRRVPQIMGRELRSLTLVQLRPISVRPDDILTLVTEIFAWNTLWRGGTRASLFSDLKNTMKPRPSAVAPALPPAPATRFVPRSTFAEFAVYGSAGAHDAPHFGIGDVSRHAKRNAPGLDTG